MDRSINLNEAFRQFLGKLDMCSRSERPFHIPLPFSEGPEGLGGCDTGEVVLVAGRPCMGKTAMLLNMIKPTLNSSGKGILYCTGGSSKIEIAMFLLAMECHIYLTHLRSANLSVDEWQKLTKTMTELREKNLWIDSSAPTTVNDFFENIRQRCAENHVDLVVIDRIDIIIKTVYGKNYSDYGHRLLEQLKSFAAENSLTFFCSAGTARRLERRQNKRPKIVDILLPDHFEDYIDLFLLIYRDDYYHDESADKGIIEIEYQAPKLFVAQTQKYKFHRGFLTIENTPHMHRESE